MDVTRDQLLVGGRWCDSGTGNRFKVSDPCTGAVVASVADAGFDDACAAAQAAAAALRDWSATSPRERAAVLVRAFGLMLDRADELAQVIVTENGKVLAEAHGEVAYAAEFFRWYGEEAVRTAGELSMAPSGENRILVVHQPVGVAYLVTPWNFPAAMVTRKVAPAIAAGCTMVLKPSELTPLTALLIAGLLHDAGLPPGVLNVVTGTDPAAITDGCLSTGTVRKVSFTGSTAVGRRLLAVASERVMNVSMELGGNAPFVVLDDADVDAAVEGAMVAKLRHNGQTCTAANRFLVHANRYDEFTAKLGKAMASVVAGSGFDAATGLGPLIDRSAVTKVSALVDLAVSSGATAAHVGAIPNGPGAFFPATLLTEVSESNPILAEEIFGPVAPCVAVSSDADALALANSTEMGLAAYVYTSDLARGLRFSEALEAGMVGLNRAVVSDPAAPFGGVKQSGLGREGGRHGLLDFLEPKYIATDW